ncbi:hypothetical protein HY491_04645 [Candidatus Woesearchaeota archaeon]|nr:hypothetical protein [Candidatus Woesearchaeota archaeon]
MKRTKQLAAGAIPLRAKGSGETTKGKGPSNNPKKQCLLGISGTPFPFAAASLVVHFNTQEGDDMGNKYRKAFRAVAEMISVDAKDVEGAVNVQRMGTGATRDEIVCAATLCILNTLLDIREELSRPGPSGREESDHYRRPLDKEQRRPPH